MRMSYPLKLNLIYALLATTLLSACSGFVARQTSEQDRDTSGRFDGPWRVSVAKGAEVQHVQNWTFNCGDMTSEFDILIQDGTFNLRSNASTATSYVSKDGNFKISLPLTGKASASGRSDSSINNGERRLILSGRLGSDKPAGIITYGIADFGWSGCTSKTKFSRIQPSV